MVKLGTAELIACYATVAGLILIQIVGQKISILLFSSITGLPR